MDKDKIKLWFIEQLQEELDWVDTEISDEMIERIVNHRTENLINFCLNGEKYKSYS